MIAPDIIAAVPLEPFVVRVVFADGQVRDVDIEPLLDGRIFAPLRDHEVFAQVSVDEQTGTVAWPNGARSGRDLRRGIATARLA